MKKAKLVSMEFSNIKESEELLKTFKVSYNENIATRFTQLIDQTLSITPGRFDSGLYVLSFTSKEYAYSKVYFANVIYV